ncbi:probable zinc transporter 8 [Hibiscus syriacus]|uniref:probable zinc transporter 8 n=1 Tax=Hibiscus syriacus TaxID=106335 RepID=UPI00192307B4|nr:probable zinc transporter 8 [Hibiscus syriacus]
MVTIMIDSIALSLYKKHHALVETNDASQQLLRHRVVAQVLEMGIIVHSVVIGLAMGASENPCTIRFTHRCSLLPSNVEYKLKMKEIMVVFFSSITPLGIALGIGLSRVYSDTSPTVVGLLNACSTGFIELHGSGRSASG